MKIITKDLKHGLVKIRIDDAQDAWYLSKIIESGDLISGMSERKIKIGGADEKAKISKRIVFIKISAEKSDLETTLRVSGKIIEAPDDIPKGDYHTFEMVDGTVVTIEKENWSRYALSKLEEAANAAVANIMVVVFDREEAIFAVLKRQGYEILLNLKGDVSKKDFEDKKTNFYGEIYSQIMDYDQKYAFTNIIIASPAFWKEYLLKEFRDEALRKKIVLASCSSVDDSAIDEVLKRPELKTVLEKDKAAKELRLIDDLLGQLAKDMAVYGLRDVADKLNSGNIATVILSENLILRMRHDGKYPVLEDIMHIADSTNSDIRIISSDDAMKKLDGITGIAGLLRWKENYS